MLPILPSITWAIVSALWKRTSCVARTVWLSGSMYWPLVSELILKTAEGTGTVVGVLGLAVVGGAVVMTTAAVVVVAWPIAPSPFCLPLALRPWPTPPPPPQAPARRECDHGDRARTNDVLLHD